MLCLFLNACSFAWNHNRKCCLKQIFLCLLDKNANRKTRLKDANSSKQKGRGEQESEQKRTVIVNIVIVIGSNNHILISCECVFYPNSGWLQTKKNGKKKVLKWLECLPYKFVSVCVNVQFQLRNSKQYRLRTVDVAPQTCVRECIGDKIALAVCVCASTSFLKPHLFTSENKQKSWHKSWVTVTIIYCCCCCCFK